MIYLFYTISFLSACYILLDRMSRKKILERLDSLSDRITLLNRRVIEVEEENSSLLDKVCKIALRKKKK